MRGADLSVAMVCAAPQDAATAAAALRRMQPEVEVVLAGDAAASWAAAANAAARAARREIVLFLGGLPEGPDWADAVASAFDDPHVAAAGGRVVDASGAASGGMLLVPISGQPAGFALLPATALEMPDGAALGCDLLGRPCAAFRRSELLRIGGFDAAFADGDEVFDACLRLREGGARIVELPRVVVHRASPEWPRPTDRDERRRAFLGRWWTRALPRPNCDARRRGVVLRSDGTPGGRLTVPLPPIAALVYGPQTPDPAAFAAELQRSELQPERLVWATAGAAPVGTSRADAGAAARELTELRGEGYVAFVRSDAALPPHWLDRLVDALEYDDDVVAATSDAATLVSLRLVPQHLRIDPALPLDAALAGWLQRATAAGRSIRAIAAGAPARPAALPPVAATATTAPAPFASIVMLSWNAPEYTEQAVRSIARHTPMPHETIVIDNGSDAATRARLARLDGVRVHYNERNLGFADGCNQGAALARGTHVVWLNNDVLVTEGWLDALIALQRRRAAVGISVPVSNNVHGHQHLPDAPTDPARIDAFAAERAERLRGRWYRADVVMGVCLCVAREVIDEIGGFDPRYAIGNFEDVDYCVRARAAGYEIGVCEDAFVHHFGSVSFRANNVDYGGRTQANMHAFVARWRVDPALPLSQAVVAPIRRGFVRSTDAIPLPEMNPLPDRRTSPG